MADKTQELLATKFSNRFEDYNTKVLKELANTIKQFKGLNYSQAYKLGQQLKYNKSYTDLLDDLSKLTGQTKKDLEKVLEEAVKQNIEFADTYYKAKGLKTPIYKNSPVLQNLVQATLDLSEGDFVNIAKNTGFAFLDKNNHIQFLDMKDTYHKVIDDSIYAISTGKDTFDNVMRSTINQLADSGVRRMIFANDGKSQYTQRLDTVVRRNILDSIAEIHNETQEEFGKEFGADGVEITVHENPAPDHAMIQGRQFKYTEYRKLQDGKRAKDYKGNIYQIKHSKKGGYRKISQYNCYHATNSVILGISEPIYSDKELQEIINRNNNKVLIDGKEYTKYEATQLQRQLETEIRKSKDAHIMYKETGDTIGMLKEQKRISQLTNKYREVSRTANIPEQLDRARVSDYRRIATNKGLDSIVNKNWKRYDISDKATEMMKQYENIGNKHFNFKSNDYLNEYTIQTKNMYKRMEENIDYKNKMINIMENIDELKKPVDNNYILYSGGSSKFDLTDSKYTISTTFGIPTARQYMIGEDNPIMNTIYVEKGANLISTYNTPNQQFKKQGEMIIPITELKNLKKLAEGIYLLKAPKK